MLGADISQVLERLREGLGAEGIAVRCDCKNLETVYVMHDEEGRLVASDRGETIFDLARGSHSSANLLAMLDERRLEILCATHGVTLAPPRAEYPRPIYRRIEPDGNVRNGVDAVAKAVDAIFSEAQCAGSRSSTP